MKGGDRTLAGAGAPLGLVNRKAHTLPEGVCGRSGCSVLSERC